MRYLLAALLFTACVGRHAAGDDDDDATEECDLACEDERQARLECDQAALTIENACGSDAALWCACDGSPEENVCDGDVIPCDEYCACP